MIGQNDFEVSEANEPNELSVANQAAILREQAARNVREGIIGGNRLNAIAQMENQQPQAPRDINYLTTFGFGPAQGRYGPGRTPAEKNEIKAKIQETYKKYYDAGVRPSGTTLYPNNPYGLSSMDDWLQRGGVAALNGKVHQNIYYSMQNEQIRRGLKVFKEWARAAGPNGAKLTRHPVYRYLKSLSALSTAVSMLKKFGKKSTEDREFTLDQVPRTPKQYYKVTGNAIRSTLAKMKKWNPATAQNGVAKMEEQVQKVKAYYNINTEMYNDIQNGNILALPALINRKRGIAGKNPLSEQGLANAFTRHKAGSYLVEPGFNI